MDYISVPQSLIYKHRDNLKDFGVHIPGTLNHYLFSQMRKMTLLQTEGAKDIALQCFNNAYYICTLIQFEEFPDLCIDQYEKKLLEVKIPFCKDVCAASMAIVCELLPAYDAKWRQKDNFLISSIQQWFSHNKWINSLSRLSFENIFYTCNSEDFSLPLDEFAPLDIIEAIEGVSDKVLVAGIDYICERLALLDDPKTITYGADLAIARLNDMLRDVYEDYGYDPKTNSFEPAVPGPFGAEPNFEECFHKESDPVKKAIEYIESHRPTEKNFSIDHSANISQKPETEDLVAKTRTEETMRESYEEKLTQANNTISQQSIYIKKVEDDVRNLKEELQHAQEYIEEIAQEVEKLTAEQKVRMALALELLKAAGLNDKILDKRGNGIKVATVMMFMTGIVYDKPNKKGKKNQAQYCQTFLSDKGRYFPRKENMDTLIKINNLLADLGVNVSLSLESQSNR